MIVLEITPTEEFVSRSSATPMARMHEWREVLLSQNPVHFERWNHKLREIPGIGFRDVARPWTLSAPGSFTRPLGFQPSDEVLQPFESIADFYHSLTGDTMEVFQKRYRLTPEELKKPWIMALRKQNELLYSLGNQKMMLVRKIGFGPSVVEVPETFLAKKPIGFASETLGTPATPKAIASYKEFIALIRDAELSELHNRVSAIPKNKLQAWVTHLKRTNRKDFRLLVRRLESRSAIGFGRAGEEIWGVPPHADAPTAQHPIGFLKEQNAGDCSVEIVLDQLLAQRP